ncbi:hypothetical protein QOT17_011993 [Balamuthia mandrillaris]
MEIDLPLNDYEKELFHLVQLARTEPTTIAKLLKEERLPNYDGSLLTLVPSLNPKRRVQLETHEGAAACQEAISFLNSTSGLPALSLSKGLTLAAKKATNKFGQEGSREIDATAFISEFGRMEPGSTAAEICALGARDAKGMLFSLLICDGDDLRSQRKDMFEKEWTHVGLAVGKHNSSLNTVAVVLFARNFQEKATSSGAQQHGALWRVNEP